MATFKELVDEYIRAREAHDIANAAEKAAKEDLDQIKGKILSRMDEEGLQAATDPRWRFHISETKVFSIEKDQTPKFDNYILSNDLLEFLYRRVNNAAIREYLEAHPGVSLEDIGLAEYVRRTLNATKAKDES